MQPTVLFAVESWSATELLLYDRQLGIELGRRDLTDAMRRTLLHDRRMVRNALESRHAAASN